MQVFSVSVKGLRNQQNEDAYLCSRGNRLFLIADGMGGHQGSAYASQTIVRKILQLQHSAVTLDARCIEDTLLAVNIDIYEKSQSLGVNGIGSTLSLIWFDADVCRLFHVGDSRIYRYRDFKLQQLTTDHIAQTKDLGDFTEAQTSTRGITRAIGIKPKLSLDQYVYDYEANDLFLLLSDGITDMVQDYELSNYLSEWQPSETQMSGQTILDQLITLATQRGGTDDKTAVLLFI